MGENDNIPSVSVEFLKKEFDEINLYIRSIYTLYITWYTFWIAFNLAVAGWIVLSQLKWVAELKEKGIQYDPAFYILVCCFMIVLGVLGLCVCGYIDNYFKNQESRIEKILEIVLEIEQGSSPLAMSPLPLETYIKTTHLTRCAIATLVVIWFFLLIYPFTR